MKIRIHNYGNKKRHSKSSTHIFWFHCWSIASGVKLHYKKDIEHSTNSFSTSFFIKTMNIQSVRERTKSRLEVRQLERFVMNSTVLCKVRLSVHRNIMKYKIQNIKVRIKYISVVRVVILPVRKPQLHSRCVNTDNKKTTTHCGCCYWGHFVHYLSVYTSELQPLWPTQIIQKAQGITIAWSKLKYSQE